MKTQISDYLTMERHLWRQGFRRIAGVDEAGRGPLAGPVVAAAVILHPDQDIPCAIDSKMLSPDMRQAAFEVIIGQAQAIAVAASSARRIDSTDILKATMAAMRRAVLRLSPPPDYIIIDGNRLPGDLPAPSEALVDGDARSRSTAAASIIAKVVRDLIMERLHRIHPEYGFAQHKGYGTPEHLEALALFGPTRHHRFSFAPIRQGRLTL